MKWEQLCKLGRELPEVDEGIWYRTPSLAVRRKSFVRLEEDGTSVVFLVDDVDEQQAPKALVKQLDAQRARRSSSAAP